MEVVDSVDGASDRTHYQRVKVATPKRSSVCDDPSVDDFAHARVDAPLVPSRTRPRGLPMDSVSVWVKSGFRMAVSCALLSTTNWKLTSNDVNCVDKYSGDDPLKHWLAHREI